MKIRVIGYRDGRTAYPYEHRRGYSFVVDGDDYDWLVVFERLNEPCPVTCDPRKTILATWEPTSIKHYSRAFTRQFAYFLSNRPREAEGHPNYRLGRGYFPWFLDRSYAEAARTVIPPKTRAISAVCSDKRMRHTDHYLRYRLVSDLARLVPGLEWFGRGVRGFREKSGVLDAYRYHVAVENCVAEHYWTEKVTDAFLAECLPFYAGAPDLGRDFPPESFIPIPMDDPREAAAIINGAMAAGEYERRLPAVREAKRRVLERFNFWQQVIDVIAAAEASGAVPAVSPVRAGWLLPHKAVRWRSPSTALEDGAFHVRQYLNALLSFRPRRGLPRDAANLV